ncbi:MAG: shikimate kinase [Desulfobacterales bacterium]
MPPDDKKNIVLIGMPGVGKSTIGVLLAKHLGYSFLDTDLLIQVAESQTLQQLIQIHGISGFCDLEEEYIRSVTVNAHVIATGGSVVYGKAAMRHLKTDAVAIHLDLSLDRLQKRLDDLDARGVAIAPGRDLSDLYAERHPLYLKYADQMVETDALTPDQVVKHIVAMLSGAKTKT